MIVPFKYYLHDGKDSSERLEHIREEAAGQGIQIEMDDEELNQLIGRPFYEVTLFCTLDTETGKVEVMEILL